MARKDSFQLNPVPFVDTERKFPSSSANQPHLKVASEGTGGTSFFLPPHKKTRAIQLFPEMLGGAEETPKRQSVGYNAR